MKSKHNKSQANVEFLMILSILLIFLLIFISIITKKNDNFDLKNEQLEAKTIVEEIANNINNIYLAGDGSYKEIYLSEKINGISDYNITIFSEARLVQIDYKKKAYNFPILTSNIDNMILNYGKAEIRNNKGKIEIIQ
jgi:uncharacterized protein (UPF0333 family)